MAALGATREKVMRNPGTDFHRRAADERAADAQIAGQRQSVRNAVEWLRRASAAAAAGNTTLADNIVGHVALYIGWPWDHNGKTRFGMKEFDT